MATAQAHSHMHACTGAGGQPLVANQSRLESQLQTLMVSFVRVSVASGVFPAYFSRGVYMYNIIAGPIPSPMLLIHNWVDWGQGYLHVFDYSLAPVYNSTKQIRYSSTVVNRCKREERLYMYVHLRVDVCMLVF